MLKCQRFSLFFRYVYFYAIKVTIRINGLNVSLTQRDGYRYWRSVLIFFVFFFLHKIHSTNDDGQSICIIYHYNKLKREKKTENIIGRCHIISLLEYFIRHKTRTHINTLTNTKRIEFFATVSRKKWIVKEKAVYISFGYFEKSSRSIYGTIFTFQMKISLFFFLNFECFLLKNKF